MSVLAALVAPRRVTIFFDCRADADNPADQPRLEQAFEASIAATPDDDIAPEAIAPATCVTRAELAETVPVLLSLAAVEPSARVRAALNRLADRYATMTRGDGCALAKSQEAEPILRARRKRVGPCRV
jgi:hypothetical protein